MSCQVAPRRTRKIFALSWADLGHSLDFFFGLVGFFVVTVVKRGENIFLAGR